MTSTDPKFKDLVQTLTRHLKIPDAVINVAITENGDTVKSGTFDNIGAIKQFLMDHMKPGRFFAIDAHVLNQPNYLTPSSKQVH